MEAGLNTFAVVLGRCVAFSPRVSVTFRAELKTL